MTPAVFSSSDTNTRARTTRAWAATCALLMMVTAAAPACGARGPLEDDPTDAGPSITNTDSSTEPGPDGNGGDDLDGSTDTPDGHSPNGGKDGGKDSGATGPQGFLECGTCLANQCGTSFQACLQSTACQQTLQCVATKCMQGGQPDLGCAATCSKGDTATMLQLFQLFQCVTDTCGSTCSSSLETILKLIGGLGGADAGIPGPKKPHDAGVK